MTEIDIFPSKATVAETVDLANNTSFAIEKAAIEDEFLINENTRLKTYSAQMTQGIGVERGKELTDAIVEADGLRDNMLNALIHFLKGYLIWNDEANVNDAKNIMDLLKAHGKNISNLSYEKESAILDSIIIEFEKPEMTQAIAVLGLTALIAQFKEAQSRFKWLYYESAEKEAGKPEIVAPSLLKRETQNLMNSIFGYLNIMAKAKPVVYSQLASVVSELVNSLSSKVRNRYIAKKNVPEIPEKQ